MTGNLPIPTYMEAVAANGEMIGDDEKRSDPGNKREKHRILYKRMGRSFHRMLFTRMGRSDFERLYQNKYL